MSAAPVENSGNVNTVGTTVPHRAAPTGSPGCIPASVWMSRRTSDGDHHHFQPIIAINSKLTEL
jgi:hypothetical protein